MPISAPDLAELAKVSLDEYLRNTAVDQISTETPFLKKLMGKRKMFLGAKQNVVSQVRKDHGSNFAWAYGETPVSFNKRNMHDQVAFPWRRAVDALYLDFDRLFGNGIKVREGERGSYRLEQNEKVQLSNLLKDQMEGLRDGFMIKLNQELLRSGSQSADAVTGLDSLISTTPNTGIVGGIDRGTALWYRNHSDLTLTNATILQKMEAAWRSCIRYGGQAPDFILAGSDFVDAYRGAVTITNNADSGKVKTIDGGVGSGTSTGLYYKGVEIIWDPTFGILDSVETTAPVKWEKRCYFINTKHIKYYDDDMDVVIPTRPHNVLAMYAMVNLRCALAQEKSRAHAVLALS